MRSLFCFRNNMPFSAFQRDARDIIAVMKYKQPSSQHLRQAIGCMRCSSENVEKFSAEMNMHFPGYEGLTEPTVWVFPQLTVCLHCGWAEFSIPELELQRLAEGWQRIRPKAA